MNEKLSEKGLSYAGSGVDIEAQSGLVDSIKSLAQATPREGVLAGIGGFGALFELPVDRYCRPVLVSGSDGVGTKLMLANRLGKHDTIGIDLVAMCVNDVVCHGADPLYFLDYYATGKLDVGQAEQVISGIAEGAKLAGCALIGGETAEMPGMYQAEEYDLAGFCVGAVDKDNIIAPHRVQSGDVLLALASSGPHSNGYSLIRNVLKVSEADLAAPFEQGLTLGDVLLMPTRIYATALQALWGAIEVHGLAHVTGGGLVENVPRMLPPHCDALLDASSWQWPAIFQWLQSSGNISMKEMLSAFNVGVGMVVSVAPEDVDRAISILSDAGERVWPIGKVVPSAQAAPVVRWGNVK